jgi:prepilin-type N-terminal cleavage/methylation domain-containing protein
VNLAQWENFSHACFDRTRRGPDSVHGTELANTIRMPAALSHARTDRRRAGFTLVEVMIASALLGMSLIVMFGFQSGALRSNMNARRLTDCTYLAQAQLERLVSLDWQSAATPSDLTDGGTDPTTLDEYAKLEYPSAPAPVNVTNETTATWLTPVLYTVTWDATDVDDDDTMVLVRVRCTYDDTTFNTKHGTTISSLRFRDS